MMKNYDQSIEINHNPNWPYIPDHPHRTLIIWWFRIRKNKCVIEFNNKKNDQKMTKFTHMSKIHSNQSITCLLMEEKM